MSQRKTLLDGLTFRRRHLFQIALLCSAILIWFDDYALLSSPAAGFRRTLSSVPLMFNRINPNPEWCKYATCKNSPSCKPCERRFLIIIASGRSGSTTLTQMMNELPFVRMAGENANQMYKAEEMIFNLKSPENPFNLKTKQKGAWMHNFIPDGALSCPIQDFFAAMNPPLPWAYQSRERYEQNEKEKILGFKTIRFHNYMPHWTIKQSVNFVKENFPCSRILVNYRSDTAKQALSRKAAFKKDLKGINALEARRQLQIENSRLLAIAEEFGEQAYLLDMSKWTDPDGGVDEINKAMDWLGFQNCTFKNIRHDNAGRGYSVDMEHKNILNRACRYDYL